MVAHSEAPGFVPADRPSVAIASDGTLAAIAESSRVVVLEIPGATPFAEISVTEALATQIAWVGAPPRLVILSRHEAHSTVQLIDPYGPRTIAEIRLESAMKLLATVGAHALAISSTAAAVLTATDTHLTPYQFPARAIPTAAGGAAGNFVVALGGSIEEWDPHARMPKRRLRLAKPAVITSVGGSDRVVWLTTQQDPSRLDVIPLVNRGQPKSHDLPEAIAYAVGHPRSDLVVCIGAETGSLFVVDTDGRAKLRTLAPEGIDRTEAAALVVGRLNAVLAAQTKRAVAVVGLDPAAPVAAVVGEPSAELPVEPRPMRRTTTPPPPPVSKTTLGDPAEIFGGDVAPVEPRPVRKTTPPPPPPSSRSNPATTPPPPGTSPLTSTLYGDPADPPARGRGLATTPPATASSRSTLCGDPEEPPAHARGPVRSTLYEPESAESASARLSAWREKMRQAQARSEHVTPLPSVDRGPSWRDDVVLWARAVFSSIERSPPAAPPIVELAARFDLSSELIPALVLLYGAHLAGERGAAPVDVARVLGRRWDEALGSGQLAERGLALYVDSRVRLAGPLRRVLDEVGVTTGTLVGEPGAIALLGPCVVVDIGSRLATVAERCLSRVGGAILAAHDDVEPGELFMEARARGAAPMLRVSAGDIVELGTDPAVLVVSDESIANQLGVPRLF